MASRINPKRGKGRSRSSVAANMEEIRDAEISRREYKTPQQIEQEAKYVYGNDVYTVSRILAKRLCKGKKEYLIKWHGYPKSQATWEPASNILDPSVIKKFEGKRTVNINVSHEQVMEASIVNDGDEDEEPSRKRRNKRSNKRRNGTVRSSRKSEHKRRWKRFKSCEEIEEKEEEKNCAMSSEEKYEEKELSNDATISRDGDSSSEEIAEEPLTEKEIRQWVLDGSFASTQIQSDSSESSSLNEIQELVNMMTERVAMEIEADARGVEKSVQQFPVDLNNNEDPKVDQEIGHSVEIPPPGDNQNDNCDLIEADRAQGSILGSATRSGVRVYLVKWSTGSRQVLTETDIKQKWPQLLIKFYESNIHWLKKLK